MTDWHQRTSTVLSPNISTLKYSKISIFQQRKLYLNKED